VIEPSDGLPALPVTAHSLTAPSAPPTTSLDGNIRADVAVIGAGITGLSAALHAASAGANVVVLESREIGWGASGRSFGQVVPYLRHDAERVMALLGPAAGEKAIAAAASGPELVFSLVERHGIICEATRRGLLFGAHTPSALNRLERRWRFWRERRVELALLDARGAAEAIGGGRYWGALLEPRGGTINSLAFARGLAAAAMKAGAMVHTFSKVRSLTRDARHWVLTSTSGTVIADRLLLCTDAYSGGLSQAIASSVVLVRGYQFVSRPLAQEAWSSVLPGGQALTDTRKLMSGVRKVPGCRLQASGGISFSGPERSQSPKSVTRRLHDTFPQIGVVEWEACWSGLMAMTLDEIPRLQNIGPGAMAAYGYSGRGLALAALFGRELARWAAGAGEKELVFPLVPASPIHSQIGARLAARGLSLLFRADDLLAHLRFGHGPAS
jgi:glycine/D-amino acid oxidase-like deaminating enzyme